MGPPLTSKANPSPSCSAEASCPAVSSRLHGTRTQSRVTRYCHCPRARKMLLDIPSLLTLTTGSKRARHPQLSRHKGWLANRASLAHLAISPRRSPPISSRTPGALPWKSFPGLWFPSRAFTLPTLETAYAAAVSLQHGRQVSWSNRGSVLYSAEYQTPPALSGQNPPHLIAVSPYTSNNPGGHPRNRPTHIPHTPDFVSAGQKALPSFTVQYCTAYQT